MKEEIISYINYQDSVTFASCFVSLYGSEVECSVEGGGG